jgi:hypothetical protein
MKLWWLFFVVLTVLSWGAYVPTVHHGQKALGANSALRAFLFIGLAYFVLAAIVFIGVRFANMEPWNFSASGCACRSSPESSVESEPWGWCSHSSSRATRWWFRR